MCWRSKNDWMFLWLWSVVQNDDSPMQVEKIDDPMVTHLILKGLDRHSHYRFYLRGRTSAGDGEPIKRDGATTLDGGMWWPQLQPHSFKAPFIFYGLVALGSWTLTFQTFITHIHKTYKLFVSYNIHIVYLVLCWSTIFLFVPPHF